MSRLARAGFLVAFAAVLASSSARAAGPLAIYDAATRTPYAWPKGDVPVYVQDSGFGPLTKAQVDSMVAYAIGQWNAVPTSSFHAVIAGNFSDIGLPLVDASNIFDVLGTWNGGGIHIVYDADGSIHQMLFGPYSRVLGFAIPEFVDDKAPYIREVTIVLNGGAIPDWMPVEDAMTSFAGVFTHEFGHAIGLAHAQTNGQLVYGYEFAAGPEGCPTPYSGTPTEQDIETMYPIINVYSVDAGRAQSTVDLKDEMAILSDLYPAPGWPASAPGIRGTIAKAVGKRGKLEQVGGVNVIARNLANPYHDAISALSGAWSQGDAGPDGAYAFHGLTPGAQYAVYVDGIIVGGFSTPQPLLLPGPEEYFSGSIESGDGIKDDRCSWAPVKPVKGDAVANIVFNRVKGAPTIEPIDLPDAWAGDISGRGDIVVGGWAGGLFRWTADGAEDIGGSPFSPSPGISDDGKIIVGDTWDPASGTDRAAIWQGGTKWAQVPMLPGVSSCDAFVYGAFDVSNTGAVVGLAWLGCTEVTAFRWTQKSGPQSLGHLGPDGSRADKISSDGRIVAGWDRDEFGQWLGAVWKDGREQLVMLPKPAVCGNPSSPWASVKTVGAVNGMNSAGTAMTGEGWPIERVFDDNGTLYHYCDNTAWRSTRKNGIESLGEFLYPYYVPIGASISEDGNVVAGIAFPFDPWSPRVPFLWTPATGYLDFQAFLEGQGLFVPGWFILGGLQLSADGTTVAGTAATNQGFKAFVVNMPSVIVCHAPGKHREQKQSIAVEWADDDLREHLEHGDTVGICGNGH